MFSLSCAPHFAYFAERMGTRGIRAAQKGICVLRGTRKRGSYSSCLALQLLSHHLSPFSPLTPLSLCQSLTSILVRITSAERLVSTYHFCLSSCYSQNKLRFSCAFFSIIYVLLSFGDPVASSIYLQVGRSVSRSVGVEVINQLAALLCM